MKTRCQSIFRAAYHTFDRAVFAGAVLLIASSAQAQNLFEASCTLGGNIYEYTPGGVQNTFATALDDASGMAFDSAGDLFVASLWNGNIYKFTPGGVQSIFASGCYDIQQLAFNSAGDLFATVANGSTNRLNL